MARDLDFAARFLTEFQDRVMYGTDICNPESICPMDKLLIDLRDSGKLAPEAFTKIARGNAIRLLGL